MKIVLVLVVPLGGLLALRWILFDQGILYGDTSAQMANFAVAGGVIAFGYMALRNRHGAGGNSGSREGFVAVLTAVIGLAVAGYGLGQIVSPVTPQSASVPACSGVPVNGAKYYAITTGVGNNARSGPGAQYKKLHHYPAGCTLGFDGYCVGQTQKDIFTSTPDQRWLLVHRRPDELVSASAVLTESAESALGTAPAPECASLGGLPQPHEISSYSYNARTGSISAQASNAQIVGYAAAPPNLAAPLSSEAMSMRDAKSPTSLPASDLPAAQIASDVPTGNGQVVLGAVICLAVGMPVVSSLQAKVVAVRHSKVVSVSPYPHVSSALRARLSEFACNGNGD